MARIRIMRRIISSLTAERLIELGRHEKVVGVGETGLDQHYKFSPSRGSGRAFSARTRKAARALDKTLIIHTREADTAMAELLEEEAGNGSLFASSCTATPAVWN